jgi:hypothetical protein
MAAREIGWVSLIHALFAFHTGHKYCHNGGMGFAPSQLAASARPESLEAIMAPPDPRNNCYAVKMRAGGGSLPFGGSDGLVCLPHLSAPRHRSSQAFGFARPRPPRGGMWAKSDRGHVASATP